MQRLCKFIRVNPPPPSWGVHAAVGDGLVAQSILPANRINPLSTGQAWASPSFTTPKPPSSDRPPFLLFCCGPRVEPHCFLIFQELGCRGSRSRLRVIARLPTSPRRSRKTAPCRRQLHIAPPLFPSSPQEVRLLAGRKCLNKRFVSTFSKRIYNEESFCSSIPFRPHPAHLPISRQRTRVLKDRNALYTHRHHSTPW